MQLPYINYLAKIEEYLWEKYVCIGLFKRRCSFYREIYRLEMKNNRKRPPGKAGRRPRVRILKNIMRRINDDL